MKVMKGLKNGGFGSIAAHLRQQRRNHEGHEDVKHGWF